MVDNLPCYAGDVGSIPSLGTKIPRGAEQLSLCAKAREYICHQERPCRMQLRLDRTNKDFFKKTK